jgi:hypothetical protein
MSILATLTLAALIAAAITYLWRYDRRHGWHAVSVVPLDSRTFVVYPSNAHGEALPALKVNVVTETVSYLVTGELASERHSDWALDVLDNHLRAA